MTDTIPFPSTHAIDTIETRWAAGELERLLHQISADSVAAMILRQAQRELQSLGGSAGSEEDASKVVGPFRLRFVA